jgi:hypothetical protein
MSNRYYRYIRGWDIGGDDRVQNPEVPRSPFPIMRRFALPPPEKGGEATGRNVVFLMRDSGGSPEAGGE